MAKASLTRLSTIRRLFSLAKKTATPPARLRLQNKRTMLRYTPLVLGISLLSICALITAHTAHAYDSSAFVMVVKTDNPGSSSPTQFKIPTSGGFYNYNVDCNDDGIDDITGATASVTCNYATPGTYTVAVTGLFPQIQFMGLGDAKKLIEVRQWGTNVWATMSMAFQGCSNLHITASDNPNLSAVTSFTYMFYDASVFNENIDDWDVSHVTDMYGMFINASAFNQPLGSWNTSNVTDMSLMFINATSFNQQLSTWNTANVTNMSSMFKNATSFNQPLSSWDVGNVTNMSGMFSDSSSFNQPIGNWDTSIVTNMSTMFINATAFNQSLSGWNTGMVTNMSFMFNGASAFNQPLGSWNTSNVTDMTGMFGKATSFNQSLDDWDISKVTSLRSMFESASSFNQPLNTWNPASATDMGWMFANATSFNQPLDRWNTSKVTNMELMFTSATSFNQPIGMWDTSSVTSMSRMFYNALAFNQPLDNWNTSNVTDMVLMFFFASAFNGAVGTWDTSNITDMSDMFGYAYSFNQPINNWDVSHVTNMESVFLAASAFNQPLDSWNTSRVTNMHGMFTGATSFNQPIGMWDVSAVTNMDNLFSGASSFNQDISTWDISHVTSMTNMLDATDIDSSDYDKLLTSWASQAVSPNNTFSTTACYTTGGAARNVLTSAPNNWVISDGGQCPASVPVLSSPSDKAIVNTATPVISGTSTPHDIVKLKIDGTLFSVTASDTGSFTLTAPAALSTGWHTLEYWHIDVYGSASTHLTSYFQVYLGTSGLTITGNASHPTLSWSTPPASVNTYDWKQEAASGSSFPVRGGFSTASFNGKLWVLGGQGAGSGPTSFLNDVWNSVDGKTWTQALASAPWSKRQSMSVVVFNNKLWLIGGRSGGQSYNDVWSSPDGTTWTKVAASTGWTPRASAQVVVKDGKMWLLGGMDNTYNDLNDVWSSSDGATWTKVTDNAGWAHRHGFGAVAYAGKLWVLGGVINNQTSFANDVWSSTDGITWTQVTSAAAWPERGSHQAVVADNKIWVIGGSAADWNGEYNDAWTSTDGASWENATIDNSKGWVARRGFSATTHNGNVYVIGGRVGVNWDLSSDVWSSYPTGVAEYMVCWDTVAGGCAHSAKTTATSYTIQDELAVGSWYFSLKPLLASGEVKLTDVITNPSFTVANPAPLQPVIENPKLPVLFKSQKTSLPDSVTEVPVVVVDTPDDTSKSLPVTSAKQPASIGAPVGVVEPAKPLLTQTQLAVAGSAAAVVTTVGAGFVFFRRLF